MGGELQYEKKGSFNSYKIILLEEGYSRKHENMF
jgi:hypothetical protein